MLAFGLTEAAMDEFHLLSGAGGSQCLEGPACPVHRIADHQSDAPVWVRLGACVLGPNPLRAARCIVPPDCCHLSPFHSGPQRSRPLLRPGLARLPGPLCMM